MLELNCAFSLNLHLVERKTKNVEEGSVKEWKRFYHVFESGELEKLIEAAQDLHDVESYYDELMTNQQDKVF